MRTKQNPMIRFEPPPDLHQLCQNEAFVHKLKESILLALLAQGKLTQWQYDNCMRRLEHTSCETTIP